MAATDREVTEKWQIADMGGRLAVYMHGFYFYQMLGAREPGGELRFKLLGDWQKIDRDTFRDFRRAFPSTHLVDTGSLGDRVFRVGEADLVMMKFQAVILDMPDPFRSFQPSSFLDEKEPTMFDTIVEWGRTLLRAVRFR